jgi:hypothetical protein
MTSYSGGGYAPGMTSYSGGGYAPGMTSYSGGGYAPGMAGYSGGGYAPGMTGYSGGYGYGQPYNPGGLGGPYSGLGVRPGLGVGGLGRGR